MSLKWEHDKKVEGQDVFKVELPRSGKTVEMSFSRPQYRCSECKEPYVSSFNSVKRANRYITTHWCYSCMKDTTIEEIDYGLSPETIKRYRETKLD
jgi:hypothetical protein